MTVPEGDEMSIVKTFDEMNAEQRLAYRIGYGAAQADLANGERLEPDYAAGVRALIEYENVRTAMDPTRRRSQAVRAIVDAAVGGRLLVDPPKEEERT